MNISTIGLIIFFLLYGINHFANISFAPVVLAITAIVIAIALISRD